MPFHAYMATTSKFSDSSCDFTFLFDSIASQLVPELSGKWSYDAGLRPASYVGAESETEEEPLTFHQKRQIHAFIYSPIWMREGKCKPHYITSYPVKMLLSCISKI